MSGSISDDLWSRLDRDAGRVPGQPAGRYLLVIGALSLTFLVGNWVVNSGEILPRVAGAEHGWESSLRIGSHDYQQPTPTKEIYTSVTLVNEGWGEAEILGIGADIPGLRFNAVTHQGLYETSEHFFKYGDLLLPLPFQLPNDDRGVDFHVHFTVTDCQAVPSTPQSIPVRVARPWGETTVYVQPVALRPQDGGFAVTTRDDPNHVEWQRFLADDVCGLRL